MKIRPVGGGVFNMYRRTDGHYDETNNRFSQFCERAWKKTAQWETSLLLLPTKYDRHQIKDDEMAGDEACMWEEQNAQGFDVQTWRKRKNRLEVFSHK